MLHVFLRFYALETKNIFGWDQVDNAWAAKDIIVDHKLPLLGMVAKGNSGFYIGPAYYYLIAIVYWVFNLDPISSGVFAGITSIFTFFTFFYVIKKIFSNDTALIAVFIYTISFSMISFDRVQWPVNFIPSISFIIFYSLYNIINSKFTYLISLGIALGFSFHIHFTSIYYPIIILLSLPFFPWNKRIIKYIFILFFLFLVFLLPIFISEINTKASSTKHLTTYINTYFHGVHLTRVMQLAKDAFIKFEGFIIFPQLKFIKYLFVPAFFLMYCSPKPSRKKIALCYLVLLWFIVPWFVFSVYKGEISDYYFSSTIPIVVTILSYLIVRIIEMKSIFPKVITLLFFIYYSFINIQAFFNQKQMNLQMHRQNVRDAIRDGRTINFAQGNPDSYLYYIYTRK